MMRIAVVLLLSATLACEHASDDPLQPSPDPLQPSPPPPPAATDLMIVSGAAQTGIIGEPLAEMIVVEAIDSAGAPVAGAAITFAAVDSAGTFNPAHVISDAAGVARSTWTLGPRPGPMGASVSLPDTKTVVISATARPLPATSITAEWDTLRLIAPVQFRVEVVVRDRLGNTITDPDIKWSSSDTHVATVSDEGVVSSLNAGGTLISATVDQVTIRVFVEVSVTTF